jgi:hypothetical protein
VGDAKGSSIIKRLKELARDKVERAEEEDSLLFRVLDVACGCCSSSSCRDGALLLAVVQPESDLSSFAKSSF